jgi:hypothetical protein
MPTRKLLVNRKSASDNEPHVQPTAVSKSVENSSVERIDIISSITISFRWPGHQQNIEHSHHFPSQRHNTVTVEVSGSVIPTARRALGFECRLGVAHYIVI